MGVIGFGDEHERLNWKTGSRLSPLSLSPSLESVAAAMAADRSTNATVTGRTRTSPPGVVRWCSHHCNKGSFVALTSL